MNVFENQQVKQKVQVSENLPMAEQAFIATRKEEVRKALAKFGIQCSVDKVPHIAVLGSGGGLRAMIALYGTLTELKKCSLLDCVTYLSGVSGSTWCMSSLYKNEDWSEKIETLEKLQCEKLVKGQWDFIKAKKAVLEASRDENYSLTDFWAYFIVYYMLKELDESKLSQQRRSCENGKNPYPIYAAVDKHTYSEHHAGSWFEFTPHNSAVPDAGGKLGIGGYVDMKHLGSVFGNGNLCKEKKEKTICYLQGFWGSALGSQKEIKNAIIDFFKQKKECYFAPYSKDVDDENLIMLSQVYQGVLGLELCACEVATWKAEECFDLLENHLGVHRTSKSYQALEEMHQNWLFLDEEKREERIVNLWEALNKDFKEPIDKLLASPPYGPLQRTKEWFIYICKTILCILTWRWGSTSNFLYNLADVKVPELERKDIVSLIDAGAAINSAYPLVLHPERNVKLILSFDFSAGDPFETVKKAAEYCKVHGIKFPTVDESNLQDKDNPSNCCIFRGDGLTIMHFPLFNKFNCQDKIEEYRKTFKTFKLSYSDEEIGKLLAAAKKNVADVQEKIVEEIKYIVGPPSQMS